MKEVIFGVWKVCIWKADDAYQGEVILTASPKRSVSVPAIMQEGIPFTVTPAGVKGENVKYIFPPLIPRIIDAISDWTE